MGCMLRDRIQTIYKSPTGGENGFIMNSMGFGCSFGFFTTSSTVSLRTTFALFCIVTSRTVRVTEADYAFLVSLDSELLGGTRVLYS